MSSKIDFQILIATMNREKIDFLYSMFPFHDINKLSIIIINQTDPDRLLKSTKSNIKVINSFKKGLSKSRNLALHYASADWCLISDDDVIYLKNFEKVINLGISTFSKSGVIVFKVKSDKNIISRWYPKKDKISLNSIEQTNVCSIEMLVNKDVIKNKVNFNVFFGLGSNQFYFGEELVFINDVKLNTKTNISYYNKNIVRHIRLSTGEKIKGDFFYFTKGGVLRKVFPRSFYLWVILQLFFDVKQKKLNINTIFKAFNKMIEGSNSFSGLNHE
jgi:hypothetical protein